MRGWHQRKYKPNMQRSRRFVRALTKWTHEPKQLASWYRRWLLPFWMQSRTVRAILHVQDWWLNNLFLESRNVSFMFVLVNLCFLYLYILMCEYLRPVIIHMTDKKLNNKSKNFKNVIEWNVHLDDRKSHFATLCNKREIMKILI